MVRGLFLQAAALRAHSPPNQPVDQRRDLLRRKITTVFVYNSFVYWYNGEGTRDMAHDEHMQAYTRLLAGCGDKFREGVDVTRDNAIMVDKLDQAHDYANWIVDLYNTLGCFFRRPDRSARLLRREAPKIRCVGKAEPVAPDQNDKKPGSGNNRTAGRTP